ncbi:MAG: hypothetical protein FD152_3717, partial [Xanthobacteraceae bacterium]
VDVEGVVAGLSASENPMDQTVGRCVAAIRDRRF